MPSCPKPAKRTCDLCGKGRKLLKYREDMGTLRLCKQCYADRCGEFKERVLLRDRGRCVKCGWLGGPVHHIEKSMHRPRLHELHNAETLCQRCHDNKHGK